MHKILNENNPKAVRIMFMGSPSYAASVLTHLVSNQFNICAVISQPDKKVGRGKKLQSPPVKTSADEMGLTCYQPRNLSTPEFIHTLETVDPELIVVAAYGKILRKNVLDYPRFGCVNVHASLLPRWRGASPIHSAILNGDNQTGVTIMKMDEGIDTGDILEKRAIPLHGNETTAQITENLGTLGGELLTEVLPDYINGKIPFKKQEESEATYAGLIKKSDGKIDFSKSAVEIERMVRAYNPWPIAFFEWNNASVKVYKAEILDSKILSPGERGIINKYPCVGTSDYDLKLDMIQLPGKKIIEGKQFLNGARNWNNSSI